jgi:hypothetical protein
MKHVDASATVWADLQREQRPMVELGSVAV